MVIFTTPGVGCGSSMGRSLPRRAGAYGRVSHFAVGNHGSLYRSVLRFTPDLRIRGTV
jgi:hypothetical protein